MAKKKPKDKNDDQIGALSAQNPGARPSQEHDGVPDVETTVDMSDVTANPDIVEHEDGSADVYLDDAEVKPSIEKAAWDANLAEHLPEHALNELATKYMQSIEDAIEARKKRDEQYEMGLKKAGLGSPAPGGAEFEGASRVTHPVLAEAYVDFSASAMKELFPPNGPVRTQVIGEATEQKLERAKRKVAFMNKQLTKEIPEYRTEMEVMLTQLPAGGSQFMKIYWNDSLDRTVVDFVGVDEMVLPFNAKGFERSPFFFHRMTKNEFDMSQDVNSGLYRDVSVMIPDGFMEDTKTETQTDKIEGKDFNYGANENGEFILFEGTCYEDSFDDPKRPKDRRCPYIITLDEGSSKVLSIYRNWEKDDKKCLTIPYMVEFVFIPWRGAYGIGLYHLIGDLASALTGSLRALLDSAHIQNSATAIKLKGRPGGETVSAAPTQISEIDAVGGDDIRKIMMPIAFNGPSPVLLQLLGFLDKSARGVVSTSEEKIADAGSQMPVGTTMALIEQGAKVYSSIHARLHWAQEKALTILHRINHEHIKGKLKFGEDDNDFVTKDDFAGPLDVYPVSDPDIFSETQRYAQMQAVMAMAEKNPQAWNLNICYQRMLQLMKVPDYKELLSQPPKPKPQNPAAENVMMSMGSPTAAFPEQDHLAHLQVHLDFLKSPMFGMSVSIGLKLIPAMMEHIKQHMIFYYADLMRLEGRTLAGEDLSEMSKDDKSWQTDRDISAHLAKASPTAIAAAQEAFQQAAPILQAAMKFMQDNAPKPPPDPNTAVAMQELQQRAKEHTDQMSLDQQKIMNAMKKVMGDQALRKMALEQSDQKIVNTLQAALAKIQSEAQTDLATTHADNISQAEIQTSKDQNDMDETILDNQTAIEIAEMRGSSNMTTGGSMKH